MAVPTQYPCLLLPEIHYRVQQQIDINDTRNLISVANGMVPETCDDFQLQPAGINLLRDYNAGLDSGQYGQRAIDNSVITVNELGTDLISNLAGARKRSKQGEGFLVRPQPVFPAADSQHNTKCSTPSGIIPTTGAISAGLHLTLDLNPPSEGVTGTDNGLTFLSFLKKELQSQMRKQREEMEELIRLEGERIRQTLEETRQTHTKALLASIDKEILRRFKERETELDRAKRRNLKLQERVRQLSLESQLWQNMARNNELLASNLRSSLEQVVAQSREQSKEGCGESEVDDAESCHYGARENREMELRACRVCKTNEVCILLLPCRHLCLCKDCDARLSVCPLCRLAKTASVQVYMA